MEKIGVVRMIRLSTFVRNVVAKRKIPDNSNAGPFLPTVLMKMDIEGSEADVLPDMLFTGALPHINVTMMEYHRRISSSKRRNAIVGFSGLRPGGLRPGGLRSGGLSPEGLNPLD